jgi:hypothetical protein
LERFALIGFGAFVGVSLVVGMRLLLLARRTRRYEELSLGITLFCVGGLSYAFLIVSPFVRERSPELCHALIAAGVVTGALGTGALLFFVWQTFRPTATWAGVVFGAAACCLTLAAAAVVLAPVPPLEAPRALSLPIFSGCMGPALLGYGWSAFESFRYHAMLRKRVAIGLAEPEIAHRFFLWGCAGSAAMLCTAISIANRALVERGVHPVALLTTSVLGLVAGVALWLTFFPPRFYRRLLVPAR